MAITDFPLDVDESLAWSVESSNVVLHNIITHNITEVNEVELLENNSDKECKEDDFLSQKDLSPRAMKVIKSRNKRKKWGNGEVSLPIRVQPKRSRVSQKTKL